MADDPRLLQWRNLPMELRLKNQWLVAHPVNKNPLFHEKGQFYNGSVSKHASSQWMSFEQATSTALAYNLAIGFVIAEGEDITCIDLDVKPTTTKETLDLFQTIVKSFDTYTERSVGGHGIHIWCKGNIGLGRRRDGVEIYSQNRFMICTGKVLHLKEHLEARQSMLTNMVSQMPLSADHSEIVLEELPQIETDEDIGRKLWENEDARMLWQGMWQELDHPSQSEGDLDLMVHLVRLSPSNDQVKRLFRQSGLGKRTKANRADYVLRTLRHARYIRQNELVDIELGKRSAEAILAKYDAEQALLKQTANGDDVSIYAEPVEHLYEFDPPEIEESNFEESQTKFPPGGLGYLAHYFYRSSIYPNVEFSTAAAIGVMSAICGRAWNTHTGLGLNTYNLVVAPSGMGKEEMQKGIKRLIRICEQKFPTINHFFHFGHFASGQGLIKHFNPQKMSFLHVMAEFGALIRRFSTGKDENMQGLMSVMLDLYSKSSPDSVSNAITYSDSAKNILSLDSPSYSILGDTTPEVFESISSFLLNNGLISRFNIFEYKGERNRLNRNVDFEIDSRFIDHLIMLARISENLTARKQRPIAAILTKEAQIRYDQFDDFQNTNYNLSIINRGQDIEHHMWSRSLGRINVLATLAAILDTPTPTPQGVIYSPEINEEHWDYFEKIIMNDINNFKTKQESGDLGGGDNSRVKKIEKLLDEYLNKSIPASYNVKAELQASRKIAYSYLRARVKDLPSFRLDGNFNDKILRETVQTLIQIGRLKEIKDPVEKGMVTSALYWIMITH